MNSKENENREKNPREDASWISILTFSFAFKIFRKGLHRDIQENDVYEIVNDFSSEKLGNRLEKAWKMKLGTNPRTWLMSRLLKLFWKQAVALGASLLLIETPLLMYSIAYPLLVGKIVSYFTPGQSEITLNDALLYTAGLILNVTVYNVFMHFFWLFTFELGLKIKIACSTLIYRKCLRLRSTSLSKFSNGLVVTLMTKDVSEFNKAFDLGIAIGVGLCQSIVLTGMMYLKVGVAAVLGVSFVWALFPIQVYLGTKTAAYRLKTASKTDQRVRITQEILTAMRIIKTYTWELFFSKSVRSLRSKEIRSLRILFYIKTIGSSIGQLSSRLALYICVMAYIAMGNHITAEKAFVVTGCFGALSPVFTMFLPSGIAQIAELKASIQRITDFLLLEEVPENSNIDCIDEKQPTVSIANTTVKSDQDEEILDNANLEIKQGITVLTGSVGAGKSTLLKLLLGDVKQTEGIVDVRGKMSYASQEPWLFPGTVKQNIIFGEWFDEKRYETVIQVCALRKDFDALPQGDKTCVTDRGLNLSRGQKTRINLARAVYKIADIYLLDDCLSAVDTHVGKHIFHKCFKGFLKDSICISVSHHDLLLREADNIVILSKGCVKFQGNYSNLKEWNSVEIKSVLNNDEDTEKYVLSEGFEEKVANNLNNADESSTLLENVSKNIYEETKEEGSVKKDVYYRYITAGGGIKMLLVVIFFSIIAQVAASWSDYFVSFWVDTEQELSSFRFNQSTNSVEYKKLEESHDSIMKQYSFVILAAIALSLLKAVSCIIFSSTSSTNIHNLILERILNAGMIFFDLNLSGNVLNRFSRDLAIIDEQLPFVIFDVIGVTLTLLGTFVVVSSVNLFFLIPSAIFTIVLFFARRLYLPTGRSIRRLEGSTRSPVIGHLNATLEGLTTIRASQAQNILKREFDRHQDLYNSVTYMNLSTTRAFGFYLDIMSSLYITVITLTFLFIKTDTLAGKVGLAITQSFSLTGVLQWGIRQWAELENQMTSAERVLEYTKIDAEEKSGDKLTNWPNDGKIEYGDVNLRYSPAGERVLKDLCFTIQSKQKIGIVGRTGAGKSSIISTLFRMYEYRGTINIDDVDINSIAIDLLRSKISVIPQDPVLFSGTVRSNLDPNGEYADNVLWDALEEVELKKLVDNLNSNISERGSNFSIGQRQLLCLARAVIRQNIILILDEATANVDPQTDALIQRTIRRKFSDCTVITIAHRLHTIMDSDRVLVMDSGTAVEYDHPKVLLDKKGLFYNMVKEAGLL